MYEVFAHTADAGLRIRASDLAALFEDAGRGLFSLIVANPESIRPQTRSDFEVNGGDAEYLLVDWLSELLFAFESQRMLFSQFQVSIDDDGLKAIAWGERIDLARHRLEHEVKAITYHGLSVNKDDDGWSAEVVVDI